MEKKSKKKLFVILLDAFSSNYINHKLTPFLYGLTKNSKYIKKLIPSIGFCERAELFSGLSSFDNGYLTAINFSTKSPYRSIKILLSLLNFFSLSNYKFIDKILRRLLWIYSKIINQPMHPQNIPLNLLGNVSLTEDLEDIYKKNALGVESIFDIARKNNIHIDTSSFTSLRSKISGTDISRINNLINSLENKEDIYFLYISELDYIGHKYGPNSINAYESAKKIDTSLEKVINNIKKIKSKSEFIIIGDHGMDKVKHHLNVLDIINKITKKNKLKLKKDYLFFLDSTILRIFFKNNNTQVIFENELKKNKLLLNNGQFFEKKIQATYNITNKCNYGDLIWWANSGTVINPSFYSKKNFIEKGMHGYINNKTFGFAIILNNYLKNKIIDEDKLCSLTKYIKDFIKYN